MKNKTLWTAIIIGCFGLCQASVDFGGTWAQPVSYGATCTGNKYVNVGFHVNWESNNNTFQIWRSKDINFSWSVAAGSNYSFNGCGSCGAGMYSIDDYGPFVPGEVWYYRAVAISHNANYQYKYLGPVTIGMPTVVDWVSQVTSQVVVGNTPAAESSYIWAQESRDMQGITISLMPTEISKIYLELNNSKINFDVQSSTPFFALDINVDNGGYNSLYSGPGVTSFIWASVGNSISSLGAHNLKVRFTAMSGTIFYREYEVFVVPKSDALYVDNYCNTIRVWRGSNQQDPSPLILSEGFDAYNTKPAQYYRHTGQDLIGCLLNKGFDVYIVDYELNAQSIKNNAAVFQSAVRFVSSINANKKVAATGISMGGIINRFACAKAENDGNPLPISVFATFDAPQQGAVVSVALQNFRKAKTDAWALAGQPDPFTELFSDNDAAKELLLFNAYDPNGTVRTNFMNTLLSLNGDGYPHLVEKVGVAFSTTAGNPNSGTWLSITVQSAFNGNGSSQLNATLQPEEQVAGSFLPQPQMDNFPPTVPQFWASFGLSFFRPLVNPVVVITQFLDPTFIPHTSALDMINGVSKYDKQIIPAATGYHDVIPADIVDDIVNALIAKDVYIQNKTYNNVTRTIIAQNGIYVGNNVTQSLPQGDVVVNSNSHITFKAGNHVEVAQGFQSPIDNFAIVLGTVQCDGSIEFQNKVNPLSDQVENAALDTVYAVHSLSTFEKDSDYQPTSIYPNPTGDYSYVVNLSPDREYSYHIRNIYGVILEKSTCINTLRIDFTGYPGGAYIVELIDTTSDLITTFKILKL